MVDLFLSIHLSINRLVVPAAVFSKELGRSSSERLPLTCYSMGTALFFVCLLLEMSEH